MACRYQLVVHRGDEQVGNLQFGQAVGYRKHHAIAQFHIQYRAIEPLTVQQAEGIKHAVGMGDVVATVLKCLFHECRQIELVLHQKQIAGRLAGRARHEVGL